MATTPVPLSCPDGHTGPWKLSHLVEAWHDAHVTADGALAATVGHVPWDAPHRVKDSARLVCWAVRADGRRCTEHIPAPPVVFTDTLTCATCGGDVDPDSSDARIWPDLPLWCGECDEHPGLQSCACGDLLHGDDPRCRDCQDAVDGGVATA